MNRPKFTRKVRRGLALARGLLIDSFDPDAQPSTRQVKGWRKAAQSDFNAAMVWLESLEEAAAPEPEPAPQ